MNALETRAAATLASVYLLRMLGLFMVMPVLAVLAPAYPDYQPWLLGLAIGGYGLTQALLQIPMGLLSDRIGRKPVILIGLTAFALGSLLAALADSMWLLVAGRLLQGAGAIAGAIMALAADLSRESQRAKVMAIIGIAIGFSFYLALVTGPILAEQFGLSGIFLLTGLFAFAAMPLVHFLLPTPQATASGDTLPTLTDIPPLAKSTSLLRLNLSVFMLHLLITLLFVHLPRLFVTHEWPLAQHWQLYLPVLILSVLGMALLMRSGKKYAPKTMLQTSIGILAVSCLGLAASQQILPGLLAFCVLFFIGFNYLEANLPALLSGLAPAGKKGSAMGIYASFQFAGAFAGGLLAGALQQQVSFSQLLVAVSLLCLLWIYLLQGLLAQHGRVKRVTLPLQKQHLGSGKLNALHAKLTSLAGVLDIQIATDSGVAYLKVDDQQFNLQQAQQLIQLEK